MTDLIEQLKKNQVPWKWIDGDSAELLLEAKRHNSMVFMDKNGWWQVHKGSESMGVVYRVKKDYRPEIVHIHISKPNHVNTPIIEAKINELVDAVNQLTQNKKE